MKDGHHGYEKIYNNNCGSNIKKRLNELSSKYSMEAIITYCNRRKIDEIANLDFFFRGYYHQSVLFTFFCDRNGKIRTDSFLFLIRRIFVMVIQNK